MLKVLHRTREERIIDLAVCACMKRLGTEDAWRKMAEDARTELVQQQILFNLSFDSEVSAEADRLAKAWASGTGFCR